MSRSSDESRQSSDGSEPRIVEGLGWIERRVAPWARWFGGTPAVLALRESLPVSFGGLLIALGVLVVFIEPGSLVDRLRASIPQGFSVMSIVLVLVLSVRLAQRLKMPIPTVLVTATIAFVLALPRGAFGSFTVFAATLGTSGLFTAIVCCLATAGALGYKRRHVPGEPAANVAGALFVVVVSGALFSLHVSVAAILAAVLSPLGLLGDSFIALFLITGIEAILWMFGIHGPALLAALVLPVYLKFQFENTAAFVHHQPLPHLVAVSTFLFVFPGGAGATLPLIVLLLRSRVPRLRKFAYATILPSLVNVNEPVMFGLPIVYNPVLGIPYVLAPLALVCTTYAAMSLNLVRAPIYYVPSTLPLFVNVFLATFDWRACVLIAVNVVIAGAIYLPFVRMYERIELRGAADAP
jgi:PTS system cellobiose-specific IIC component